MFDIWSGAFALIIFASGFLTGGYWRRKTAESDSQVMAPAEPVKINLLNNTVCDSYDDCDIRQLSDCAADFCHKHCAKDCGCGAGARAKQLITQHGSLREAERFLNEDTRGQRLFSAAEDHPFERPKTSSYAE